MTGSLFGATLVSGVLNGSLYALLAIAVVVVFRTTAVANFAQGEMAMLSVFLFLMFVVPTGLPVWATWIASIVLAGLVGAAVYLVLMRPRADSGHLNLTIRTVGLYTLLSAVAVYLWGGNEPYRLPHLFPDRAVDLAGLAVGFDQLGAIAVVALATIGLLFLFRYTELGLAMRACAMNPETASLLGVNVPLITTAVWALAAMLGAIAGLLATSISFLETASMKPLIVKALTAAVIGGMQSFPGAILGGLLLGILEAMAAIGVSIHLREPLTFAILLGVLLWRPAGIFGRAETARV